MLNFKGAGILKQSLDMSLKNIISSKMRSFLTTLGIIIGVMAVISLITIVEGVTNELMKSFSGLGADSLVISASGTAFQKGLTENNLETLSHIDNVKYVSPTVSFETSAVKDGAITKSVQIKGRNEAYYLNKDCIAYGRPLYNCDMEGDVYVCVIDDTFAKKVFFGQNPLGQTVILEGCTYTVVGIEKKDSDDITEDMSQSAEGGSVAIPYKNALKMSGSSLINSVTVYVYDITKAEETQKLIEHTLDIVFNSKKNSYWVMNLKSIIDVMDKMTGLMKGVLAGIASISLIVGGIGIMNMMLISVTERTKEIGLRKALGATPGRIQLQFLLEATILSVAGGIIGVILGLSISAGIAHAMEIAFQVSPSAIELGVGFSAAVGIIFGWAPAKKASELNPIDALRSE